MEVGLYISIVVCERHANWALRSHRQAAGRDNLALVCEEYWRKARKVCLLIMILKRSNI